MINQNEPQSIEELKESYSVSVWQKAYPIHAKSITAKNEVQAYKHKTPEEAKAAALKEVDTIIEEHNDESELPKEFWEDVRFMISTIELGRYDVKKWEKHLEKSKCFKEYLKGSNLNKVNS